MRLHQTVEQLQDISAELHRLRRRKKLRRILKLVLIGFLIGRGADKKISELTKKRNLILEDINEYCVQSLENLRKQEERIENSETYLIYVDKEACMAAVKVLEADFSFLYGSKILDPEFVSTLKEELERIRRFILNYNKKFVEQRKRDYSYLWKKGLLSLDEEQQAAIITDDKYNLVVAAAGSGKTEVLITRIAYLIARKPDGVIPSRILAIAYQRKDVRQIEQRLRERYTIKGVNVRTFHRLGLDILESAGKMKGLSILDPNERPRLVGRIYEEKLDVAPEFYRAFLRYAKSLHETKVQEDVRDKEENLELKKALPYTSIDNTRVCMHANKIGVRRGCAHA